MRYKPSIIPAALLATVDKEVMHAQDFPESIHLFSGKNVVTLKVVPQETASHEGNGLLLKEGFE